MKRTLHSVVLALSVSLLAGCGFHLRGLSAPLAPLSFSSLSLQSTGSLDEALRLALQRDGRLTLTSSQAQATLRVVGEESRKDILTINRGGKVNEYLLIYRVDAAVQRLSDDTALPMSVVVRRELSYSDAAVLGKEREEALLWADMRRDAAEQLVRRLSYLPAVTPAKPANASAQP
ncbi:MAG: LPS assembly lipoprotein LptE [Vogesella sp.]|uniref:LPS-assembly lipoprotein LptE n=1 Tax=Vogesella sp. TaxID=1904252 RepID=UPI003F37D692